MELKKVIKTILIGGGIALLGFSTFKACKNNDFSDVKTLTKETRLTTREKRLNAPKRASEITWNDINSWEDLTQYQYKVINTQAGGASITFFPSNSNLPSLAINNVDIYPSSSGNLYIYYNYDNNIAYRVRGAYYPNGEQTDIQLVVGDILSFKNNDSVNFELLKNILMASTEIIQEQEPPTATLELDLTNLTNFNLDKIYLDSNNFPLSSNIIDLTTLSDGEHTLTFYDVENDNCFNNSAMQTIYTGFGGLNEPLTNLNVSNNSDYRGQMTFTWDSSLFTENETYKLTLSGQASYNFNFLTGKSYILNAELPYLKQAGERWWLDANDTETTYLVYNYSNSSIPVKAIARTEGVDAIHGNYLIFGNNQDSSLIFGEYPIYAHQINAYENEFGVPPRLISFLSAFNNDNMNNLYYSYNGAVGNIVGDYMYSANIVDYLVANSTELTSDQIDTYQSGYNSGYNEGLKYSSSLSNLIFNFFKGIDDSLSIELIPNVQIKYIIAIPLIFGILKFILGWFR